MSEKKEDNKRAKCPVCGRFCKQEAVDKYNALCGERSRLVKLRDAARSEAAFLRKELEKAQAECVTAQKRAEDCESMYINTRGKLDQACADVKRYQDKLAEAGTKLVAMQSENNGLQAEVEKIYGRGFWARVRNKRV